MPRSSCERSYVWTQSHMAECMCDCLIMPRPVSQAPCIIALGRELHNNVGLGNACGLGPSAVSGPVKKSVCSSSLPVCLHCNQFTYALNLREVDMTPHFSSVKKKSVKGFHFSFEWWNYSKSIQRFLFSHCKKTKKHAEIFLLTPREIFPTFLTDEKLWVDRATAYSVKETARPGQTLCQNRRSRALGLLLPNPARRKTKQSESSQMTVYLDVNSFFFFLFLLQSSAACVGTFSLCCWRRLYSLLVSFFVYHLTLSVKLLDSILTQWSGPHPEKELTKPNSGRMAAGLCDASVGGGWKPCTHLTWFVWIH